MMPSDATPSLTEPGRDSGCVWIQSDLQLSNPDLARQVLSHAVRDVGELGLPLVSAWCLGDAVCGSKLEDLERTARDSVELMERLGVPVALVAGNHEMDLRRQGIHRYPMFEAARGRAGWHQAERLEDFVFERMCLGVRVFFLGDHAEPGGGWWTSHHRLENGEGYPHGAEKWAALRERIARSAEPVLTVSHYSYPGGQRPGPLLEQLLPLPGTVVAHFYGHAHIGDLRFNRERPWQRRNPIAGSDRPQFNVSALETRRSPGSHSAVLEIAGGRPVRLRIRDHLTRTWVEQFELA